MTSLDELLADLEVKRLHLTPGDIVVVRVARQISAADAAHIQDVLLPVVAPHRVMVITPDITIEILEPETPA
jgi:hypothetical protein